MKQPQRGWRRVWRKMWDNAPRQLRFTRAGRFLTGIALLTGFAAINTGNNLLFLGWGLVLSAIALSGVLSEAVLRSVVLEVRSPGVGRAGEPLLVPMHLRNKSPRLPVFALESFVTCEQNGTEVVAFAPYLLRVSPGESVELVARLVPSARGRYTVSHAAARTAYPFGFFEKSRRFSTEHERQFLVGPARMDVTPWTRDLLVRFGESTAAKPGPGDELYGLKPFRTGDDPRRIHWRKSLATARLIARENALELGRELLIEVQLVRGATDPLVERTLSFACSFAEALLAKGLRVGIVAPGVYVPPELGPAQSMRVVQAFARLESDAAFPKVPHARRVGRVIVAMAGASAPTTERYVRVGASSIELCERGAA